MSSNAPSVKMTSLIKVHVLYLGIFSVYVLLTQWMYHTQSTLDRATTPGSLAYWERNNGLRHRQLSATEKSMGALTIPSCAKGLFIELSDENDEFLCSGILLRDDLVLADTSCVMAAMSVLVWQPDSALLLFHDQDNAKMILNRQSVLAKTIIDDLVAVVQIEIPQVHFQSGWPRKRAFLLDSIEHVPENNLWDSSTRVLRLDQGNHLHLNCLEGELPVVWIPETGTKSDVDPSSLDILLFPRHRRAAAMENSLGEKWWVVRQSKAALLQQIFARQKLYTSDDLNYTLDVYRALGDQVIVEAEDPRHRIYLALKEYFKLWQEQEPFSGEPFFQWLDFGSGRYVSSQEYERDEMMADFCHAMDDEARANAHVVPEIVHGQVILRYKQSGHPVESGKMLYVWGLDGNIYVAQDQGANFHHVCISRSRPVKMAGEFHLGEHGAVLQVRPESGHYKPHDRHFRHFFRHLRSLLPDMDPNTIAWPNEHSERHQMEWMQYLFRTRRG